MVSACLVLLRNPVSRAKQLLALSSMKVTDNIDKSTVDMYLHSMGSVP